MKLQKFIQGVALGTTLVTATPALATPKKNIENKIHISSPIIMHKSQKKVKKVLPKGVLPQKKLFLDDPILRPRLHSLIKNPKKISLEKITLPPIKKITYTTKWWEHLINIPLAYGLTMLLHESGHAAIAKSLGYKDIKLHGPSPKNGYFLAVSFNYPKPNFKPNLFQKDLVSVAGVGFTTLGNVALTTLLRENVIPEKLRPFVATTSLMMMFDRWKSCIIAATIYASKTKVPDSNDIHDIMKNHFKSGKQMTLGYGILTGLTALEIGLRHKEITYLFETMIGRKVTYEPNTLYLRTTPTSIGQGAVISIGGKF